jgi:hypothetical protein
MIQNITTYYIPQNQNISKGKIYTLYQNKVTNLDLTAILNNNMTLNGILQPNPQITPIQSTTEYTITKEDYQNILNIINETAKLYNQSQTLAFKLTKGSKH